MSSLMSSGLAVQCEKHTLNYMDSTGTNHTVQCVDSISSGWGGDLRCRKAT
jgi:hypothetical protein